METIKAYVPGFNKRYYATSEGKVFESGTGKEVKTFINAPDKLQLEVKLFNNQGKKEKKTLSWVFRKTFFGGKDGKIFHKNGDRSDFSLKNIELISQKELVRRNDSTGRIPVIVQYADGTQDAFGSLKDAAKALEVNQATIYRWCNGIARSSKPNIIGARYDNDTQRIIHLKKRKLPNAVVWKKPDGTVKKWNDANEAGNELGFQAQTIRSWCRGTCKSSYYDGKFSYEKRKE